MDYLDPADQLTTIKYSKISIFIGPYTSSQYYAMS